MLNLSEFKESLLDLLYPAACLSCGEPGAPVCERCLRAFSPVLPARPGRTARGPGRMHAFSGWRAGCRYVGTGREMVLRLKSSEKQYARPLARLMLSAAGNDPEYLAPDLVTWVPSERRKIAARGFNPAELLAGEYARLSGSPAVRLLRKTRRTPDQDSVSGEERRRNVEGCFEGIDEEAPGARVLLVDDVITSGATAGACAAALLEAGAQTVHILVAARTMPQDMVFSDLCLHWSENHPSIHP